MKEYIGWIISVLVTILALPFLVVILVLADFIIWLIVKEK